MQESPPPIIAEEASGEATSLATDIHTQILKVIQAAEKDVTGRCLTAKEREYALAATNLCIKRIVRAIPGVAFPSETTHEHFNGETLEKRIVRDDALQSTESDTQVITTTFRNLQDQLEQEKVLLAQSERELQAVRISSVIPSIPAKKANKKKTQSQTTRNNDRYLDEDIGMVLSKPLGF
ncbi:hypothetical protein MMC25_006967 [Agyrium rufum]|nr:hypothetical protein [Agyrium rufum]